MSAFDTLVDFGAGFDWITPAWAFFQDFRNGGGADFGIAAGYGYDSGDIKRMLKSYGIDAWGAMLNRDGDTVMITCDKRKAQLAYNVLRQRGAVIMYAPRGCTNAR